MDPLTLMLLFGAGSAIVGAATSFGTNAYNNRQSQAMSEEAMKQQFENQKYLQEDAQAFSTQQMQSQQRFARDMWQMNADYNSQSAIDDRLRAAGRNPYLSNNSNVASVATTPGVSSSSGQGSAALANPQFSPIQGIAQLFANSGLQSSQMMSFLEDIRGKKIDNMFRGAEAIQRLRKMGVDIESGQLKNYMQRITNMWANEMAEQDYLTKLETNKNLRLQGQSMGYSIAAQALQNSYLPQQLRLDIAMKNAELYTEFQRGKLTESQYKYQLIQSMIGREKLKQERVSSDVSQRTSEALISGTNSSNRQKVLDYNTAYRIADYIVEKARNETYADGPLGLNKTVNTWIDDFRGWGRDD